MTDRTKAVLALISVTAIWTFPLIIVKTLSHYLDGWSQNFFRYFCAMLFLLFWVRVRGGGLGIRSARGFLRFIIPAVPCVLFQTLWVFAMYFPRFYPGQGSILGKSVAIFGAIFGFIFFREERKHILSTPYLGGLAAATLGAVGIVLADPERGEHVYFLGAIFTVLSTGFWVLYSVAMKRVMGRTGIHPVPAFATTSIWLTIAFMGLSCVWGKPWKIVQAPLWVVALVIVSGVVCIGMGHTLFFYSIRTLGVAIPSAVQLVTGITTPVMSFIAFGETLTGVQVFWGAVLLAGAAATLSTGNGVSAAGRVR
jgi:drug/metabolite transporter (DMT)-like permease